MHLDHCREAGSADASSTTCSVNQGMSRPIGLKVWRPRQGDVPSRAAWSIAGAGDLGGERPTREPQVIAAAKRSYPATCASRARSSGSVIPGCRVRRRAQPIWEHPWNRYADASVLQEAELS